MDLRFLDLELGLDLHGWDLDGWDLVSVSGAGDAERVDGMRFGMAMAWRARSSAAVRVYLKALLVFVVVFSISKAASSKEKSVEALAGK